MFVRVLPGLAVIGLLGFALPVSADTQGLHGAWCSDNEMLHIDSTSIGLNEHTICDADVLPVALNTDGSWMSQVVCHSYHFVEYREDGNHEIHKTLIEGLTQMTLRGAVDGTLILVTDLHRDEMHFLPCN